MKEIENLTWCWLYKSSCGVHECLYQMEIPPIVSQICHFEPKSVNLLVARGETSSKSLWSFSFSLKFAHSELNVTCFKLVWTEATKDWESCGMFTNHLFGNFHRWTSYSILEAHLFVKHDCIEDITTLSQEHFVKPVNCLFASDCIQFPLRFTSLPFSLEPGLMFCTSVTDSSLSRLWL